MEWLADPSIWMGLATLVVLEIVLGIDNLVFIAILADKLPPHQRDRARVIGLALALLMRLVLLAALAWIMKLTAPLLTLFEHSFSGRDLILLGGGLFLLFKAPWSCTNGWKAARTTKTARRSTPASPWWWRRSWCSMRCSRWTR